MVVALHSELLSPSPSKTSSRGALMPQRSACGAMEEGTRLVFLVATFSFYDTVSVPYQSGKNVEV